jgi:N-acyl-D-amino-acid deacylase
MTDLVIRHATIIDGTRAPRYRADIAISGGVISAIGPSLPRGDDEIDASGRIAAPGFIDAHTHDDRMLLSGDMAAKVSQGVTTVVAGNCGISLAPAPNGMASPVTPPIDLLDMDGGWFRFKTFREYVDALQSQPPVTNCALLVGHTMLRRQAMSDLKRPASASERGAMRGMVEEALQAGAIGVSTGLAYEPARAASTGEVIDVCGPLKDHKGLYCTHLRDEGDDITAAMEEAFRIGREVGVPIVLSHHKLTGSGNFGRSRETLAVIEERMRHQDVGLDCYPYCAASTVLSWERARISSKTLVTWSKPHPQIAGAPLDQVARDMGLTEEAAIAALSPAGAIYFCMDEDDVRRILAFEHTMVGSDGLPHDTAPHPRLWGTFPRILGTYVRDEGILTLEEAIRKMTSQAAIRVGIQDRGIIRPGMMADVTVFDPATVRDEATYEAPSRYSTGIRFVFVNGRAVVSEGRITDERPGRPILGPGHGRTPRADRGAGQ